MANWYGTSRTNYFRVKDEEAFKEFFGVFGALSIVHHDDREGHDDTKLTGEPIRRFALLDDYGEGWPTSRYHYDEETEEEIDDEEFDIIDAVSDHLLDGEVAVFQEVGAEKLRYVSGWSIAVNSEGERVSVDLDEIYQKIEEAGWGPVTVAAY